MRKYLPYLGGMLCLLFCQTLIAQTVSGKIVRAAGLSASRAVLDPGTTGYTSKTSSGFLGDDVNNSRLAFKSLPSFSNEPYADLRRGPSHLYTDFVPDANGSGVYVYMDASNNLIFRMRLGSIVPGAKGYSILIDTDQKFGATGANADPNYLPATTGINGNPGFEIEIDLFTQNSTSTGIAIYNVDNTSSPGAPVKTYTNWQDYSQTSIAATNDNGDPDFFIDFFVPLSDLASLGVTSTTPLRMSATTVMAPQPAIGGPKSDIYGLDDGAYKDPNAQYEAYINAQPTFTPTSLTPTTVGPIGSMCTAAPVLTGPITTGATSVTGTWTRSSLSGANSTATIRIYKNGVLQPQTASVTSTGSATTWTVTGLTALLATEVITAKALATNESECLSSAAVTVSSCNSSTKPATPTLSCATFSKGLSGTNRGSTNSIAWVIHVDNMSNNDFRNSTSDVSTAYFANMSGATWDFSKGCTTGSQMQAGSYKIYYTDNTGCNSEPLFVCVSPGTAGSSVAGTLAAPVITAPAGVVLTTATKTISGTTQATTAGTAMTLYVDNFPVATVNAASASPYGFSFSNLNLVQGQSVYITSEYNTGTQSTSYCSAKTSAMAVTCFTAAPGITTDVNGQLAAGSPIKGTSGEPNGTTINLYAVGNATPVATVTVTNGNWTSGTFNAVAGTSYYATATNGTCGVSSASGSFTALAATPSSRCGDITATTPASSPLLITSTTTGLSGTLSSSATATTVRIYQNGVFLAEQTGITSSTSWGTISFSAGTLANGDTLSIGIKEGTLGEFACPNKFVVSCSGTSPSFSFTSCSSGCTESTVQAGNTLTYSVTGATIGNFYSLRDSATGRSLATGVWATATSFSLTTKALTTSGSYKIQLVTSSVSATEMCSIASLARSYTILPIELVDFRGQRIGNANQLTWETSLEISASYFDVEKSADGINYAAIGRVRAAGIATQYSFADGDLRSENQYYRLKMVDIDGRFKFSKVILIRSAGSSITLNMVRPNPFNNELRFSMALPTAGHIQVSLVDAGGRQVASKASKAVAGNNEIILPGLTGLPEGIYILNIRSGDALFQEKVVKVNN